MRRRDARREAEPEDERAAGTRSGDRSEAGSGSERVRAIQRAAGNQAVAAHARDGTDATERDGGGGSTGSRAGVGASVNRPILRSPADSADSNTGPAVSEPGDPAERHADRVADAVTAGRDAGELLRQGPATPASDGTVQRTPAGGAAAGSAAGAAAGKTTGPSTPKTGDGSGSGGGSGSGSGEKSGGGSGAGEYADRIEAAKTAVENGNTEKARSIVLSVIGSIAKEQLRKATKDLQGDFEADGDALEGKKPAPLVYWMARQKLRAEDVLQSPDPKHYALGAGLGVGAATVLAATRSELPEWILTEGVDLLEGEVGGDWGSVSAQVTEASIQGPVFDPTGGSVAGRASLAAGGLASTVTGGFDSTEGGSVSGTASYEGGGFGSNVAGEYGPTGGSVSGEASYEGGGFGSTVEGGYGSKTGGSAAGRASYETEAFSSMVEGSWDPASGVTGGGTLQYDAGGFAGKLAAKYAGPNDVTSDLALNYEREGLQVNLQGEHAYDGSSHSLEFVEGSVSGPLASGLSGDLEFETGAFDVSGPSASLPKSVTADVGLEAGGEGWSATLDGDFETDASGTRVDELRGTAGVDITPTLRGDFEAWYQRTPDPVVGVGGSLQLVDLPNTEGKLDFEYGQAPGGGNRQVDVGLTVDHRITEGVNVGAGGSYGGKGNVKGTVELTIDPSKLGN